MMKTQMKHEMTDMTKSVNVNTSKVTPTRNCKDENSGVATKNGNFEAKKVNQLVTVLYDILKIYGYKDEANARLTAIEAKAKSARDKSKLGDRILQFVSMAGKGSWKDFFKYKINAFFSSVMGQEVPPAPKFLDQFPDLISPSFLYYGRGKRFVWRLSKDKLKYQSFAQSIAQSKKAAPAVSKDMVHDAEVSCWKHLTTERLDIPEFVIKTNHSIFVPEHGKDVDFISVNWNGREIKSEWEHPINRDTICFQLRRTIREIFAGKAPTWDELTKPFVPSTSSQYNFSRKKMGAIGTFLDNSVIQGYDKTINFVSHSLGPVQLKKELTELYGKAGIEDQERIDNDFENVMVKDTIGLHFNGEQLEKLWKDFIYPNLLSEAFKEQPRTIVIGLPEPLKVRCITAGPALTYTALKPMQKWLWRTLKSESVFQLIGTPVTSDIVWKQLGKLGLDEEFISGDYKASTDNLHSWVSECLLDELIKVWKESTVQEDTFHQNIELFNVLMKRALTGHLILNPEMNDLYREDPGAVRDEDFLPQKEGQLMGSIISFPFLCLANAALCRYSMEVSEFKNLKLVDRYIPGYTTARLLVNGDDCVFPGRISNCFNNWKSITSFGGLESSVGKTFRAREFLTINSVQYSYFDESYGWDGVAKDFSYDEVKYVNMGLVYAQKKDGVRGKPFYRLGSLHRDLKRTCPDELFEKATSLFLKKAMEVKFRTKTDDKGKSMRDDNGKKLKVENYFGSILNAQVPWYMPEWLGGLGLIPTKNKLSNYEKKAGKWDLKVAGFIRSNMQNDDYRPRNILDTAEWRFHSLVNQQLAEYAFLDGQNFGEVEYDGTVRVLGEEFQKLYTLTVVQQLLTHSGEDLRILSNLLDEDKMLRSACLHNQRIWSKLRTKGGIGDSVPAIYEDLSSERKDFHLACFDIRA